MSIAALLRPHRGLVFPFVVLIAPQLWFLGREVGIATATTEQPLASISLQAAASVVVAVIVSTIATVIAVVGTRRIWGESPPSWAGVLLRPTDGALAVFAAIAMAIGVYVLAGSLLPLPQWLTTATAPVGWVLGWPLVVLYGGLVVVGNAFAGEPPLAVEFVIVGVGVALTVTWLFFLSGWIASRMLASNSTAATS